MRKSLRTDLCHLLNFGHLDYPAAETRSIGWPADAQAPMVFATQLRQLNLDKTTPAHLDGKAKTIYAATQWQRTKPPGRYFKLSNDNLTIDFRPQYMGFRPQIVTFNRK
jgi:hypothetical protein